MENISIDEILILRQLRRKIVEICECIYKQEWDSVNNYLRMIYSKYIKIILKYCSCQDIVRQCMVCVQKENSIRLRDLLVQEIDFHIAEQLFWVEEDIRKVLVERAKEDNRKALIACHNNILEKIYDRECESHIEFSYIGTENVNISIRENGHKYRLFSIVSPWKEANDLIDSMGIRRFDEICVLGFGGGYVIGELQRKFQNARIKVYLPNIDIFRTVIHTIPVSNILRNKNLEFCYDPTCLLFMISVNELMKTNKKVGIYIDQQELRASMANAAELKRYILQYQANNIGEKNGVQNIGRQIEQYMNRPNMKD